MLLIRFLLSCAECANVEGEGAPKGALFAMFVEARWVKPTQLSNLNATLKVIA
jgi:hypothetical protein